MRVRRRIRCRPIASSIASQAAACQKLGRAVKAALGRGVTKAFNLLPSLLYSLYFPLYVARGRIRAHTHIYRKEDTYSTRRRYVRVEEANKRESFAPNFMRLLLNSGRRRRIAKDVPLFRFFAHLSSRRLSPSLRRVEFS